jgi:hypothetical protein
VVSLLAHELRASGQITERMLLFTSVNCIFAYVALMLFMPMVHLQHATDWRSAILHPLYLLAGAALLGLAGSQLLFVVLFVLTGASLDFGGLEAAAAAAAVFVVVRFLGKSLAILALGRLSGLRAGGAGLLSLSLLPMSGLAVAMVYDTAALYPRFGAELASVVLSAVAVLELLGPLATQFALKRAGETHAES